MKNLKSYLFSPFSLPEIAAATVRVRFRRLTLMTVFVRLGKIYNLLFHSQAQKTT
ncbi:MAG: hypothetical protein GY739_16520 [Mesoflavibacter sp.]|nr:hypothetical protein [Mesoflavibacter sp.]